MPPFSPRGGINEDDPTVLNEEQLRDTDGAEYRIGQPGVYVARGRDLVGSVVPDVPPVSPADDAIALVDDTQQAVTATDPESLTSVVAKIWMLADDMEGVVVDGNDTLTVPERSTNNSVTSFDEGLATGSCPVVFRSGSGANAISGHACIEQKATATDLCLSDSIAEGSGSYPSEVIFTGEFTVLVAFHPNNYAGPTALWCIGRGRGYGGNGGVAAPIMAASTTCFINTQTVTSTAIGAAQDYSDNNPKVAIIRRDSSNQVYSYCTTASGLPVQAGPTSVAGTIRFNGLFSSGGTAHAGAAPRIAEIIVFTGYITDTEVTELYQWGAQRYEITQLAAGPVGSVQSNTGLYEAGFDAT